MGMPVPVTGPAGPVVAIDDLRAHLRVDQIDEDALIISLEAAAVAYLDGYRGILGRAINEQVWKQDFANGDPLRLALPDVTSIDATALDLGGDEVQVETALLEDAEGAYVIASGDYASISIEYTCALPARQRPAVEAAIKMLVGHWYANREAVLVGTNSAPLPMAVDALLAPLRWRLL